MQPEPTLGTPVVGRVPRVVEVERIPLTVPFRERVARWNDLVVHGWSDVEVLRVVTEDPDVVGWGETLRRYTWQTVSDEAIARTIGANPAELVADDSLGAGLQMALYDALGKAVGAPMHALLGQPKVRDWCPISWWNTKLPPDLLAREAADAVSEGYLSHKIKARPWFDVHEQVAAIAAVTPDVYEVDIDWNSFLLSPSHALPVLRELEGTGRVGLVESPIPRDDVLGQREIRSQISTPLAEHFSASLFPLWARHGAVDGFVSFGTGVAGTLRQGILGAAFNMSFWLQICGTGITTAMTAHLGAVLTHARWPAVTGMNTFAHDLLEQPLEIRGGYVRVPDEPGLGVRVDEGLLERLRATEPTSRPRTLLSFDLGDGRVAHFGTIEQLWAYCERGSLPVQPRGASLRLTDDDGSTEFDDLHRRASRAPVWDTTAGA